MDLIENLKLSGLFMADSFLTVKVALAAVQANKL